MKYFTKNLLTCLRPKYWKSFKIRFVWIKQFYDQQSTNAKNKLSYLPLTFIFFCQLDIQSILITTVNLKSFFYECSIDHSFSFFSYFYYRRVNHVFSFQSQDGWYQFLIEPWFDRCQECNSSVGFIFSRK